MKYKLFIGLILFVFMLLTKPAPLTAQADDETDRGHHTYEGFRNPDPDFSKRKTKDFLRWAVWERITGDKPDNPDAYHFEIIENDGAFVRNNQSKNTITWIGHSTLLIQLNGVNILTDPIWSKRCSPVQFAGPERYVEPGIAFEDLPAIDLVLISHDHYDHLDEDTIKKLGNTPYYLVPLGVGAILEGWGINHYDELDWGDSIVFNKMKIICTPTRHFSGRSLFGRNKTLWASWTVKADTFSFYYGGDSGYFDGYKEIGQKYGPFDLVALPIGAYLPRWFMSPVHLGPDDAIDAYQDLKGRIFVPIHWGTFDLADEALDNPPKVLRHEIERRELDPDNFWIMKHGETKIIEADTSATNAAIAAPAAD